MNRTAFGRMTRIGPGAALALLFLALSAPTPVRGDECAGRHGYRAGVAHLDLLADAGGIEPSDASAPLVPISPCAGLKCSGEGPIPTSPTTPIPSLRSERWGALTAIAPPAAAGARLIAFDTSRPRPIQTGSSLFRPPRAR